MRAYYFRCYWSSNLLFAARRVTYIPNLRKIGQKLRSLSRTICISVRRTDIHTVQRLKWFYICPMSRIALDRQKEIWWDTLCTVGRQAATASLIYHAVRRCESPLIFWCVVQWLTKARFFLCCIHGPVLCNMLRGNNWHSTHNNVQYTSA